jgi:hypothetical protein
LCGCVLDTKLVCVLRGIVFVNVRFHINCIIIESRKDPRVGNTGNTSCIIVAKIPGLVRGRMRSYNVVTFNIGLTCGCVGNTMKGLAVVNAESSLSSKPTRLGTS